MHYDEKPAHITQSNKNWAVIDTDENKCTPVYTFHVRALKIMNNLTKQKMHISKVYFILSYFDIWWNEIIQ
jgi:hypothetical protein